MDFLAQNYMQITRKEAFENTRRIVKANLDFQLIKQQKLAHTHSDQVLIKPTLQQNIDDLYSIHDKVGQGSTGVVRKAIERKTGKQYAIKIMPIRQQERIRIAIRTFNNLSRLHHPSIVKQKSLLISQKTDTMYVVLEWLTYDSLSCYLHKSTPDQKQIHGILSKLIEVVDYMHRKGVCHRDIKPDNIMYDPHANLIKLIDFDISKHFLNSDHEPWDMWTVTGTLAYKAPEMLRGGGYNQKIDMWALGVILYQLLTKVLPFQREYQSQIIEAILKEEPDFDSLAASTLCINLLKRLLKKDPTKRISASQALRHPWVQNKEEDEMMTKSQNKKTGKVFIGHLSTTFDTGLEGINKDFSQVMRIGTRWLQGEKECISDNEEDDISEKDNA